MTEVADVSVVIVNWNTRDLLLGVIASLFKTTRLTSMEIIVVDNASGDGSPQAVRERYPEVTVIVNDANLGFAKANNIGFRASRARAVCLVNTDVVALDGVIDNLYSYLLEHPGVGAVGPRVCNEDLSTRENCRRLPSLANAFGDHLWLKKIGLLSGRALPRSSYAYTHRAEVLSGCFIMVRREALETVGPLDEDFFFYGEDTDWGKRFKDVGWNCVYHPGAEAIHFGGASTKAFPLKYYLIMEKSDLLYWRKHHPPWQRSVYVATRVLHNVISMVVWSAVWLFRRSQRSQATLKVKGNAINTVWLLTGKSLVETPGWS